MKIAAVETITTVVQSRTCRWSVRSAGSSAMRKSAKWGSIMWGWREKFKERTWKTWARCVGTELEGRSRQS